MVVVNLDAEVDVVVDSFDTKAISVSVTDGSLTFPVTYTYDLSQILSSSVQAGLATSTGDYVAVHDVNTWDFTSTIP